MCDRTGVHQITTPGQKSLHDLSIIISKELCFKRAVVRVPDLCLWNTRLQGPTAVGVTVRLDSRQEPKETLGQAFLGYLGLKLDNQLTNCVDAFVDGK